MIQKLASIRLTFASLTLLIVFMGTGIFLTLFPEYKNAIETMNETIVYRWFLNSWQQKSVLTGWVVLIILAASILFVNTFCCIMTTQLTAAIKIGNLRRWFFLIIHFMFLMVLTCHGLALFTGQKQENIRLGQGQSHVFGDHYRMDILTVNFSDNPELLKKEKKDRRQMMTRKNFHRKKNFATISLLKDNRQVELQKVFFLEPFKYKLLRITLKAFSFMEINGRQQVAVNLVISRNVFTGFFFTVYALMIFSLAFFIALTWTPGTKST